MAAAVDKTTGVSREICICSLCKETYTSPKILPCLHTFCTSCLEDFIEKALVENGEKHFPCPCCELETEIPPGSLPRKHASSFPDDRFMDTLVELINAMKEGKTCDICERREENVSAGSWCMDCRDAVCDSCLKVHLHGKFTSNHVVVSVEEMRELPLETLMKKNSKVPCSKHNELITLYCVDCREPLCVQCMAVSHRRCDNVVTVTDALSSKTDVQEVMSKLQNLQVSLDNANGLGSTDKQLEDSIDIARSSLMSACNALCEKVREEQIKQLKELEAKAEIARSLLKDRIEPQKTGAKAIQSASDRMNTLMRYGSDVEILLAYNQVRKKFDSYQGALANGDTRNGNVSLNFEIDESMEKFMTNFEKIGEITLDDGAADDGISAWGVTCTSTEDIIVTDCKNKRIQKFSKVRYLVTCKCISGVFTHLVILYFRLCRASDDAHLMLLRTLCF